MTEHVDYPHEAGRLHDCPACEAQCNCGPAVPVNETVCVFDGPHVPLLALAGRLGRAHGLADSAPYGTHGDVLARDNELMAALGETDPTDESNHATRMAYVDAYLEAWHAAFGQRR